LVWLPSPPTVSIARLSRGLSCPTAVPRLSALEPGSRRRLEPKRWPGHGRPSHVGRSPLRASMRVPFGPSVPECWHPSQRPVCCRHGVSRGSEGGQAPSRCEPVPRTAATLPMVKVPFLEGR
jgi:hypothetical protein